MKKLLFILVLATSMIACTRIGGPKCESTSVESVDSVESVQVDSAAVVADTLVSECD